jgi:hypothetical protein
MTWETLIADHVPNGQTPLEARTYQHTYSSGSAPIRVTASDGNTYVVKGPRSERQAVNDQIIGRLGMALGAPVGEVTLVSVSEEFVRINDQLLLHYPLQRPYPHGVWHGSLFRAEFSDNRLLWEHATLPENASGFALLAMLYGWGGCRVDHQFLYRKEPPPLVLSHDHGHFFPSGPNWTIDSLQNSPPAEPDFAIVQSCRLTDSDLATARATLRNLDARVEIARAVASPPDAWGITIAERVLMAEFLERGFSALTSTAAP